jgi:hypothetical protein
MWPLLAFPSNTTSSYQECSLKRFTINACRLCLRSYVALPSSIAKFVELISNGKCTNPMLVQLKRIIGRLVDELNDLGLSPETLRHLVSTVESGGETPAPRSDEQIFFRRSVGTSAVPQRVTYSRIFYEIISDSVSGKPLPQLRVCRAGSTNRESNRFVNFQML